MKKIIYLFFICYVTIHLSSCVTGSGELTGRTTTRLMYSIEPNYGMVKLPGGSFTMGANDQDVPYSNRNNLKNYYHQSVFGLTRLKLRTTSIDNLLTG